MRRGGHRRGRRANVGLSDLGCQGSAPGWGVLGEEGRGEKRRIPGEGQGGGLGAGTQSLGTPLLPAAAAATPGAAGRGAPAPGTGDPPDPLLPVLTGHRPGGDGSGAVLLRDRAAAVTASTLRPRPLRPAQHELRVPAPTCPLGGEPRARAPSRGWWGARGTPSGGWGAGFGERLGELPGSPRSRAHRGARIPLLRVFRALRGAGSPANRSGGRGQGSRRGRGKPGIGRRRLGGASVGPAAPTGGRGS